MFTIECYTDSFGIDPCTRQLFLLGTPPEKVGVVGLDEEDGFTIREENPIIFHSGCDAILAILDLTGDGEDLIYVCTPYRTAKP